MSPHQHELRWNNVSEFREFFCRRFEVDKFRCKIQLLSESPPIQRNHRGRRPV